MGSDCACRLENRIALLVSSSSRTPSQPILCLADFSLGAENDKQSHAVSAASCFLQKRRKQDVFSAALQGCIHGRFCKKQLAAGAAPTLALSHFLSIRIRVS